MLQKDVPNDAQENVILYSNLARSFVRLYIRTFIRIFIRPLVCPLFQMGK